MRILFLLLLIVPLIELSFLIQLGDVIGALPTVLLTIFTAVVGVAVNANARASDYAKSTAGNGRGSTASNRSDGRRVRFLGGVFLFFPGLISDSIGFLFLIPFVRQFLIAQSLKGMATKARARNPQGDYYEGEWTEGREPERKKLPSDVIEGELEEPKKPLR